MKSGHTRQSASIVSIFAAAAANFVLIVSTQDVRAVNFAFDYSGDMPGEGFLDPVLGPQRRAAMEYAGDIWGSLIRSSYAGETIRVSAAFGTYPVGSDTLASALPGFCYDNFGSSNPLYQANVNYPGALADHLHLLNIDPS